MRWLEKNLKTGAAEKTFISALSRAFGYTPPNKNVINMKKQLGEALFAEKCQKIEFDINEAICEFPNYGEIINTLLVIGDETAKDFHRCSGVLEDVHDARRLAATFHASTEERDNEVNTTRHLTTAGKVQ